MKLGWIAILSLGLIAGCAQYHRSNNEAHTYYISLPWGYTNTVALSSESGAAVSNSVLYTKCDVFLNFVDSLPAGSVLDHDAGCVVPVRYQFRDKELKVTELKEYCGQRGVKVHIYGSW